MRKFDIISTVTELEPGELSAADRQLLDAARAASATAYAPYSGFSVGAAIRVHSGEIVSGSNQENAAFPSGLCAERVAAFAAASKFPYEAFQAIAVVCRSEKLPADKPLSPCGACRQALSEYEKRSGKIRVILSGEKGKVLILDSIEALLPLPFGADSLRK
ncbi:MAG: cytidine deaminase [Bacteroidota bacterium]